MIKISVPKAGPQIPANIMALASKPAAAAPTPKKSPAKKAAPKKEPVVEANNVRGRKPRFVDIEVDEDRANRAVNLLSSKRTVPHQYSTVKIDLTKANDLRGKLEQAGGQAISLNDLGKSFLGFKFVDDQIKSKNFYNLKPFSNSGSIDRPTSGTKCKRFMVRWWASP